MEKLFPANFVDDSEYDDKSCQYIMNGQRSSQSLNCELSGLASGCWLTISQVKSSQVDTHMY